MTFCESSHHEAHPDTATGAARSAPDVHTLVDSRYRLHAHPSSLIDWVVWGPAQGDVQYRENRRVLRIIRINIMLRIIRIVLLGGSRPVVTVSTGNENCV